MDDRQTVSLTARTLGYLICYLLAVQPMLSLGAAPITPVTSGTRLDVAGNGVPVINIATPNAAGVSHNQYQQYNVGQQGLILNNATGQFNQTQLGGLIQNNPNLQAGREAQAIINEVTGANRSQLQGYTEVAGKVANVIVANPYGITCNGCGFINTPNVTLTTGKPQLDANGNLAALEVSKGSVIVEGKGLDGSSSDAVSIVARATEINAGIHAKDLSVTLGANRVGADGTVAPTAGEGAAPLVAVDTGALGGMYANRIHLVSSEKGVGVNLGNLAAKQGDIQLDANGKLTLRNSLSSGALMANGASVALNDDNKATGQIIVSAQQDATLGKGTLVSDAGIAVTAKGNLTTSGTSLTSGRDIRLSGATLAADQSTRVNAGSNIQLLAQNQISNSGQFTAAGNLSVDTRQLDNSGMLAASAISVKAGTLQNSKGSSVAASRNLTTGSDRLLNQGMFSAPVLDISSAQTDNSGLLQGTTALRFSGQRLTNLADGTVSSDNSFGLDLPELNNAGLISSGAALNLSGGSLTNSGEISAADITADNDSLSNQQGGLLLADNAAQLNNGTLANAGQIAASQLDVNSAILENSGTLQGKQTLQAAGQQLTNSGTVLSGGQLTLKHDRLDNRGQLQGQQLDLTAGDWQNSGNALSVGDATMAAGTLTNSGKIMGQQLIGINGSIDNSGWLLAQALTLQGDLVNSGKLMSEQTMSLHSRQLSNTGTLAADRLSITAPQLTNSGLLQGNSALSLSSTDVTNTATGELITGDSLSFAPVTLTNAGLLQVAGELSLTGHNVSNSGRITATSLHAGLDGSLDNSAGGLLLAQQQADIQVDTLNNAGTVAAQQVKTSGAKLHNQGLLQGDALLTADFGQFDNLLHGQLVSAGELSLKGSTASNAGVWQGKNLGYHFTSLSTSGTVNGTASLSGISDTLLDNRGSLLSGGNASVSAGSLTNSGKIMADSLTLRGDSLSNQGLWQGATALDAQASGGLVQSNGGQALTGGDLQLNADTLETTGTLQGERVNVSARSWLNQGSLLSSADLTASINEVLNNQGELLSQGAAQVNARILDNRGSLLAEKEVTLNGVALNNSGAVQGDTLAIWSDSVTNQGSLIGLHSLALGLSPTTGRHVLANNVGGQLLTQGTLHISGDDVTNNGTWQGQKILLAATSMTNDGVIQSAGSLQLDLSDTLTSTINSKITANGSAAFKALNFSHQGEWIARNLTIQGATLSNSGDITGVEGLAATLSGALTQQQNAALVSGGSLDLQAATVDNAGRMQGATSRITTSGLVNNSGKVLSSADLTLNAPQLINSGWWQASQLTLNAANASNSGTLLGANQLNVKATTVAQQITGMLYSGGNLLLESSGFNQLGQVVALGDATLKLINGFTARNMLVAGKRLTISSSGAIDNQGTLQGQTLTLSAGGDLTNNGQIIIGSGDSNLSGDRIKMNGSGTLQGGGNITLNSRSDVALNGFTGTRGNLAISSPGSIVNTALVYAGQNLYLYANSIRNQRGDMLAGDSLWMQRDVAGNASVDVVNTSGTIESQSGDITIKAAQLLNTRDGLSTSEQVTEHQVPTWASGTNIKIPLSWFSSDQYGLYASKIQHHHGHGNDWTTYTGSYAPYPEADEQKIAYQTISVTAHASGSAGRIAAGNNLTVQATQLDNFGSNMLAKNNILLTGSTLNNKSWTDGSTTVYQVYRYGLGIAKPARPSKTQYTYKSITSRSIAYTLDSNPVFETTGTGNVYRSVIQAGNNIDAAFSQNISNTSSDPHVSGTINTLATPELTHLSQQSVSGGVQKQSLSSVDKVAVNSPEWKAQLQSALQEITGSSELETKSVNTVSLTQNAVDQKAHANLGTSDALKDAGGSLAPSSLKSYQVTNVDSSAYPVPASDNGYFVFSTNPSSPYLVTVNPKQNGLGQLDASLFGDLNRLLGKQPGNAVQETRQQYTDANTFLGSAYLLDRLNLKPDSDFRFLGDAAFDTRYVSNAVLNQTGSQYLNGTGSDLAQMQYLMDNAASAQQSLNLLFGISLTADQVASLDHSILWWESTTINGETVMVPKLYLSLKDVAVNNGSVIAARNVNVTGGSITNSGSTLLASHSVSLDSQNSISNLNDGLVKAGNGLNLSAIGDINNISSTLQAKSVALETLDGNINNITLADPLKTGSNGLKNVQTGSIAAITAEQSLTLNSGKNISLQGASLSAGSDLLMSAWGDIAVGANPIASTSGSTGRGGYNPVQTDKVTYQESKVGAGGNLVIEAGHDVAITASDVTSKGDAFLSAANNLQLNAEQNSQHDKATKESHSSGAARTTVSTGGNLTLTAGQDLTSLASALAAEGDIGLQAGRDINLNAVESRSGNSERGSKKTVINESVRQQGTEIVSGGSTALLAGNDITSQAATVTASKDLALQAGHDVNITTATESDYAYKEETKTRKGLFSKKTTHTIREDSTTTEKASSLSGEHVSVVAGHDLAVSGSSVVGESDVGLKAGNDLSVAAATETQSRYRLSETKKSGMFSGGGIGVTFGSASSKQQLKQDGTTESQSASTIGSTGGNVTLVAGHDARIAGSDVIAKQDISVVGGSVTIDPGNDTLTRRQSFEQKQSGLTLKLTSPITDALLSLGAQAKAASEAGDDRLKVLGALKALESGWAMSGAATQSASALANGNVREAGIKISLSVGASKSKSSSEYSSNTVSGSSLNGGGTVAVVATGANGASGDLTLAGSGITGGNVTLAAEHDLNLVAASNHTEQKSSNKSSGWSAGVHVAIGQKTGIGVQASSYMASGSENGDSTEYVNSRVNARDNLTLSSGNDTLLYGAQALGNSISVNAGNNLTLASLQDTDNYQSKQQSASGGFSFTFGNMNGSFGLSLSKSKVNSEYASVGDQSGLFAGDGGYDIFAGNHTQLNGAVIASTAEAANNRLSTGTLGWDSIGNHAEYTARSSSIGISGGYDSSLGTGKQYGLSALPAVVNMHERASGTTRSAVADGTTTVRDEQSQKQDVADLSRDTESANGSIGKIFDKEKVANRMAFAQGVQELAGRVVGDVRAYKLDAAEKETADRLLKEHPEYASLSKDEFSTKVQGDAGYKAVADLWGTGGTYSMVATAVAGALGGLSANNLGVAAGGAMAPYIANAIKQATTSYDAQGNPQPNPLANTMAHAVAGAVLAQISGSNAAAGAAGAAGGELAARAIVKVMYPDTDISGLTESQKQTVSSLSQLAAGLAGGIASDSSMGVGAGAVAGKNAVENNALRAGDEKQRQDAKWSLPYLDGEKKQQAEQLISDLNAKDKAFDAAMDSACKNLSSSACQGMRQELASMGKSYDEQLDGQYIGNMGSVYKEGKGQVDVLMWQYATADAKVEREANVNRIAENWGVNKETADHLYTAMAGIHTTAAIGGAVYGMKGAGTNRDTAGSIKNVNPGYPEPGRTHNCVNCSIATDATLSGNPASALPINHNNGVPLSVLEKQYGNKFKYVSSSETIRQQMTDTGAGSRGIVFGSYGPGQPGHVFNVVNQNGTVRFLDGQTGKSADLSQFKSFQLLRTN